MQKGKIKRSLQDNRLQLKIWMWGTNGEGYFHSKKLSSFIEAAWSCVYAKFTSLFFLSNGLVSYASQRNTMYGTDQMQRRTRAQVCICSC